MHCENAHFGLESEKTEVRHARYKRSYINPVSRKLLLGAVIIFEVLFTLAVCALLLAGRGLDYWRCIALAKDAADCIRPSMGVMLFGSLIIQAIDPESEK